jgi:hypothetical protein
VTTPTKVTAVAHGDPVDARVIKLDEIRDRGDGTT